MIARLFRWLFTSCQHEWEVMRTHPIREKTRVDREDDDEPASYVVSEHNCGHVYHLRCKKCGEVTSRRLWN